MLRTREGWESEEWGANVVEMALASFLLILLLTSVIDFGRAFNSYVVITNASREGAYYASRFSHDRDGILAAAKRETQGSSVTLEDVNIEVDPDPEEESIAEPGDPIAVTISYGFRTILADAVGAGSLTLRARTEMVVFGPDP